MLILCLTIYIVYRLEKKNNPNTKINLSVTDNDVKYLAAAYFAKEVIK